MGFEVTSRCHLSVPCSLLSPLLSLPDAVGGGDDVERWLLALSSIELVPWLQVDRRYGDAVSVDAIWPSGMDRVTGGDSAGWAPTINRVFVLRTLFFV